VLDRMEFPASCYEAGEVAHVRLGFTVGRNGRPKKVVVPYASDVRFADRVLVAVAASPDWQPARIGGRTVRVKYTLPVLFSVPAMPVQKPDEDRRTWQLNRPKL
jgi:TonB family protein